MEEIIEIKPLIDEVKLLELCKKIENSNHIMLNKKILSNLVKLIFYQALKRNEIVNLRFGNIKSVFYIKFNNGSITTLASKSLDVISDHLNYMKRNLYPTDKMDLVFPRDHRKTFYPAKILSKEINYILKQTDKDINLEKIRQSGICYFYQNKIFHGFDSRTALELTSKFARHTIKHTRNILRNKIDPSGTKPMSSKTKIKKLVEQHI